MLKKYYKKKVIIIDRFTDSTIAYQHYGMGLNLSLIKTLNRYILENLKVNFTFLNIVNKTNMIRRLNNRKKLNRYDKFDFDFYNNVQKGYLKISKINKRKYQIIDSNMDIKQNKEIVIRKIKKLLK